MISSISISADSNKYALFPYQVMIIREWYILYKYGCKYKFINIIIDGNIRLLLIINELLILYN